MQRNWVVLTLLAIGAFFLVECGSEEGSGFSSGSFLSPVPEPEPKVRFDLFWDSLIVDSGVIKSGQTLSHLLDNYGISAGKVATLAANSKDVFRVTDMRAGKKWWICSARDSVQTPQWLVYGRSKMGYVVYSLGDTLGARLGEYPVDTLYYRVRGSIENSLYLDLEKVGAPNQLALSMANNVYAWTIDFSHVQKGDEFDVYYMQKTVDGEAADLPEVLYSSFTHYGSPHLAYLYDQGEGPDYFDPSGASLRKAFLKAPIEFGRMSSGFNKKRFHPVLKRVKPHLGTDYAAPNGTPIQAVGDGVVIKSEYKRNNGNYVKIRHNGTYETQYLHMSKRLVSVGQRVRQGQTIGKVGSTGLATGPHVCFRFWKNGEQVDHRKEVFPPSNPVVDENMSEFALRIEQLELEADSVLRTQAQ